ncbi:MAG TPA: EAL domain-containing protein [Burkholderiaceae bacterium]|nr:EAL domain-containing protein [Burkholderiaceae bacterium]
MLPNEEFKTLAHNSPDVIVRFDSELRRVYVNPAYERIAGVAASAVVGRRVSEVASEKTDATMARALEGLLCTVRSEQRPQSIDLEWHDASGVLHCYEVRAVPEFDHIGGLQGILTVARDVSERRNMDRELKRRSEEFRSLSELLPDAILRFDTEGRIQYANVASTQLTGCTQCEMLGKRPSDLSDHADAERLEHHIRQVLQAKQQSSLEYRAELNGTVSTYDIRLGPEYSLDGQVVSVLAVGRDITHLLEKEWRLQRTEALARIGHWQWDWARERSTVSAELCRQFGMPADWQPTLREVAGLALPEDRDRIQALYAHAFEARETEIAYNYHIVNAAGALVYLHTNVAVEYGPHGPSRLLGTTLDVSQIKSYESRLYEMKFHDPLTNLPNRAMFSTRLEQELQTAHAADGSVSVLILDLDRFKEVNDTHGHMTGDRLLYECSQRLVRLVRESDTVARLGGDEFGIILPGVHATSDLESIAAKILAGLMRPVKVAEYDFFPSVSMGVARYPDDGLHANELLQHADSALSEAKSKGLSAPCFYAQELTIKSRERAALEAALRRAEPEGQLALFYQPKVDLRTGECIGAEALLRWNHPEWGIVAPDRFIGIAEDSGIIVGIGAWVLTKACLMAQAMNRSSQGVFKVAVNLSPRQFRDDDLVATVHAALSTTGCEPQWLELEITEGLLLEHNERVRTTLLGLRDLGVSIAIDDFGTGYSALAYLKRFPINVLKIDRSFVRDIGIDHDSTALVKAIISMAHSLRLDLVAEGIETKAQHRFLQAQGCQMGQGYYHGRPLPGAEFEALLAQRKQAAEDDLQVLFSEATASETENS